MAESSHELIVQTALGFGLPRSLHVVAELGVPDHLGERAATAEELAKAVGAHPESLGRVLRILSDHGIFQRQSGKFSHTAASQLLRSDHPQSLRSYVRMVGLPWFWGSYQYLETAVRTGKPALDRVLPQGIWAHFEAWPEQARIFNEAMTGKAQADISAVIASYDFSRFSMIGDIGGGRGHLLAEILRANQTARGVLFDLPRVVQSAQGIASERLKLQGGDFFKDELPACDAYTLMEVIHDWNDADAQAILSAVRRAAAKGAKLLLIEQMLPETSTPNIGAFLDVAMMTLLGGKQRTSSEYQALYRAAGFRLDRVITMPSGASSIIEGTAV